jgi:hypothetical protein
MMGGAQAVDHRYVLGTVVFFAAGETMSGLSGIDGLGLGAGGPKVPIRAGHALTSKTIFAII